MDSEFQIRPTLETLQIIADAIPMPMFLIDRNHCLILVNDAMCAMTGHSRESLLHNPEYPLPEEQKQVFWRIDDHVFATGEPNENEEVTTTSDGSLRVILTRKRLIRLPTSKGEENFILAVTTDVTRFREAEKRAQYLAAHDTLTGVANRAQIQDRLLAAIDKLDSNENHFALLMIDFDGFKAINDVHGHPVGDEVLRIVAARMMGVVRPDDTVARFGGDEFCVLQNADGQPDAAFILAKRLNSVIMRPIAIGPLQVVITASIGIAIFPEDGDTAQSLLAHADQALYDVKRNGRQGFQRYEIKTSGSDSNTHYLESELRNALATDQLSIAYQPLVDAVTGELRGYEALARWEHPTMGHISPRVFIPVAEYCGLIRPLEWYLLEKACADAMHWTKPLILAFNVSSTQMDQADFPEGVGDILKRTGLSPKRLELEISENMMMGNLQLASGVIEGLKKLGVSIVLDNFGSAWSSMATLQIFHFDRIKIDNRFVSSLESDAHSVAIVRAVLAMAQSLGIPVTAAGVEAKSQVVALQRMGCNELQGYYIGHPLPKDQAAAEPLK